MILGLSDLGCAVGDEHPAREPLSGSEKINKKNISKILEIFI